MIDHVFMAVPRVVGYGAQYSSEIKPKCIFSTPMNHANQDMIENHPVKVRQLIKSQILALESRPSRLALTQRQNFMDKRSVVWTALKSSWPKPSGARLYGIRSDH
jgi:hypothetical protein